MTFGADETRAVSQPHCGMAGRGSLLSEEPFLNKLISFFYSELLIPGGPEVLSDAQHGRRAGGTAVLPRFEFRSSARSLRRLQPSRRQRNAGGNSLLAAPAGPYL